MDGYGFRFLSITPKDLSASKLGDLLKHYEAAIKSEYKIETGAKPDDAGIVALNSIEDNCITLRFILPALLVATGLRVGDVPKPNQSFNSSYSPATRALYQHIYTLGSLHNTPIESFVFSSDNPTDVECLSTIYPEDIARATHALLKSKKTLYGSVVAVGGKEPKIKIALDDGSTLSCFASKELTLKAAGFLYDTVKISGTAKIIISLGEPHIEEFDINNIDQFKPLSATELVEALRPHITDQLNRIDNIDDFFHKLREDEE